MNGKWIMIAIGAIAGFAMMSSVTRAADDDIRTAIESANTEFMTRFADGNAAGVAALYTDDGILLPPGSASVSGTDAITKYWQTALSAGPAVFMLDTLEVEQHDDTAIEVGAYRITGKEGVLLDTGKYIVIWKKVDGAWKLHRDIWNRNE